MAVDNKAEGVAFLIEQISATARRRKTPKCNIFLGGEDDPSYVANFTAAMRSRQYLVLRVNAAEAAENRENQIASTDQLDLLGIAKTLLSRRARAKGPTVSTGAKGKKVDYLDPQSRSSLASEEDRANAALNAWLILVRKWRTIPHGLALISKEANLLGFWRRVAMESRSVHLPLRP